MNEVAQLAEQIKSDIKEEITELSTDMKEMAQAITTVSKSLNKLITQNALHQERHELQQQENSRLYKQLNKLSTEVTRIKEVQAEEKILNSMLRKRITYIGGAVITGVTGGCLTGIWFVIKLMAKAV